VNDSAPEQRTGEVLQIHAFGAVVRLEGGELAVAPPGDVEVHRSEYERALTSRRRLSFDVRRRGRRPVVSLIPELHDAHLEAQIASFLKETEEWEIVDGVPLHERRFLRKKRRAARFEQ
jgi:hypothetical protein